jgi:hypothetical protein
MALQSFTITIGALTDAGNNGKNYVNNQPVYIKKANGTLASIYRDLAGTSQISQDGLSNVTNSKGQFTFFVDAGDYNAEYQSQVTPITVVGPDYFNNRIDDVTKDLQDQFNALAINFNLSPAGFDFATGGTLTSNAQTVADSSGNDWIYTQTISEGGYTVAAGTVPSEPAYKQVSYSDQQLSIDSIQASLIGAVYPLVTSSALAVGDVLPSGVERIRVDTVSGLKVLVIWEGSPDNSTITSIGNTPDTFMEYTIGSSNGVLKAVELDVFDMRNELDPRGWGAIPFNTTVQMDWETPVAGHDSTASIIRALTYAQEIGKQDDNTAYTKAGNLDLKNNSYIISGENPLGAHVDDGSTYHYSINNGQFIWNRGGAQELFGNYNFNNARRLNLNKLKILITGNSDVSGTVFGFGSDTTNVRIGGGNFSEVEILCGSVQPNATENCCETVFSCGGSTLADRFSVNECSINGFQNLFSLDNTEAVSWSFNDTSILTGRDHATFFSFKKNWSGSMHITGSDIIGLGNNNTVFSAKNNNDAAFSIATIHISSRFEMRGTDCNWFDIEHSDFVVKGMNQLAGSGSKTGHTALSLRQAASIDLENSTLVKGVRLWTVNTLTASRKGTARLKNCSFEGGQPIVSYGLSSGDIRSVVSSGFKTTTMLVSDSNRTVNGTWGIPIDERGFGYLDNSIIGRTDTSGIYRINSGGAPISTTLPSNVFITRVDIVCSGRSSGTDKLWLYLDDTPVKSVTLNAGANNSKYELLASNIGAYAISPAPTNANVDAKLVLTDSSNTPYTNAEQATLVGWATVYHRPVKSQADYSASQLVGLR